ncbi:DUF3304 domain-containing protein [Duganella sp. BJB1802]|uniref:DUF3304 domain-containing protein n=1 Tax=Duganella sp. BJB1802 TaxID=2744575 RepID=UPI0015943C4F|nr:DUF3304 domain-containing protein [Duganella sp. BJB1802]NVD71793.1 DUF3304 domain-containing protein [Duganella sp. BJB1802]
MLKSALLTTLAITSTLPLLMAPAGAIWKVGGGIANICCTSIPRVWHPGMKVLVRWDMPVGHQHIVKEKVVEVEKYERPGDIYLVFLPNDEVHVVVSRDGPGASDFPIQHVGHPSEPN